jgi:hypothetical protein
MEEGLQRVFALPLLIGGTVVGVMEFFSREIREPNEELLRMLARVGAQVGQFMERKRAEEELDRFFTLSLAMLSVAGFDGYLSANPAWNVSWATREICRRSHLNCIRRSDADDEGGGLAQRRRPGARVRESVPCQRRYISLARMGRRAVSERADDLCRGARHHGAHGGAGDNRAVLTRSGGRADRAGGGRVAPGEARHEWKCETC